MISNIGEGATPLMYACQQCREKEVVDLIARKRSSVRERDRTLKTPLHYCTENTTIGCAEAVLRAAPDLLDAKDEDGYTALHLAVIAGNKTFLRFLISRGANVNALDNERHSTVHWATVCGEEGALEIIIRAGANISTADIHGGYPLHYAAQMCGPGGEMGRDPKIGLRILSILLSHDVDISVKDKDGRQPILWAASAGSADAILALVKAGASVEDSDKDGLTALHCAASRGHTDCIETLVTLCGANVDVIDSNGCTALFYAVTLGHADSTQLLLSLGAEPNRQDRKGRTPAHCGAAKGQLETLRILLNYGANLWLRNVKGDFPLHEAIASGRRELVRWLLNQRLDSINIGNNDGRCPIHVAAMNDNIDMIKILLDAQSLINPIMRTTKGDFMTPLDAALHRGFRGCAKYLQLHGGVPFTKLTEKSSNIRGTSSRQITTDVYVENYGEQLGVPSWNLPQNSSTSVHSFVPIQIRMGGDNAIQQIETSDLRTVTRIPDIYEDGRSSDDEKIYRRRRRRKKWEHQRKNYISEEDSNLEDQPRSVEYLKRKQRTSIEEERGLKKREQLDESSSSDNNYKRKVIKKKDYASESDDDRRRAYYSATEDSEIEKKEERRRKSRKESSQKLYSQSGYFEKEKQSLPTRNEAKRNSGSDRERFCQSTVAEVHAHPLDVTENPKTEEKEKVDNKTEDEQVEQAKEEEKVDAVHVNPESDQKKQESEVAEDAVEVTEFFIEAKQSIDLESQVEVEREATQLAHDAETKTENELEQETISGGSAKSEVDIEQGEYTEQKPEGETVNGAGPIEKETVAQDSKPVQEEENNVNVESANADEQTTKEPITEQARETTHETQIANIEETENPVTESQPNEEQEETEIVNVEETENPVTESQPDEGQEETEMANVEETEDPGTEWHPNGDQEYEEEEEEEEGEEEEEEGQEFVGDIGEEKNGYSEQVFEVLDSDKAPYSRSNSRRNIIENNHSVRDASHEHRLGEAEGSVFDESGGSTRNEDSSALMDSGIEPSPRHKLKEPGEKKESPNSGTVRTRVPRLCNKGKEPEEVHTVSVTQTVQNTIRKYHMERRIFYQLLELKRLQIRAGRANEQVLVKRLVDEYRRGGIVPGLQNYSGQYTFRQFEKFLYDQLRTLQSTAQFLIPKLRPSDDIETLSTILRKSRVELVDDIPENPKFCTLGTHRCHHAAHAYTGIPCAAYITKFNHHEMPKTRNGGFLPHIDQTYVDRQNRPVTLEVSHGKEKQVISLPTDRLDKNKRYYVTFTIKGGQPLEESKTDREGRMLRYRHAKSF